MKFDNEKSDRDYFYLTICVNSSLFFLKFFYWIKWIRLVYFLVLSYHHYWITINFCEIFFFALKSLQQESWNCEHKRIANVLDNSSLENGYPQCITLTTHSFFFSQSASTSLCFRLFFVAFLCYTEIFRSSSLPSPLIPTYEEERGGTQGRKIAQMFIHRKVYSPLNSLLNFPFKQMKIRNS